MFGQNKVLSCVLNFLIFCVISVQMNATLQLKQIYCIYNVIYGCAK